MTTVPTDEWIEEMWVYCGRRLDAKGRPYRLWLDSSGEERIFDKLKGEVVGGVYAVATKEGSARLNPSYQGGQPRHEKRDEWMALERADLALKERAAVEKRHAVEDTEYSEAIASLRAIYRKMPSHARRSAFLWLVTEGISL